MPELISTVLIVNSEGFNSLEHLHYHFSTVGLTLLNHADVKLKPIGQV